MGGREKYGAVDEQMVKRCTHDRWFYIKVVTVNYYKPTNNNKLGSCLLQLF